MTQLQERRTRSHSQLSNYLSCSWAFRLKRIKRVAEDPSVWLPGGIAFHTATEEFDRASFGDDLSQWADPAPWQAAFIESFERQVEVLAEQHPDVSTWRTAGRKTAAKPNGEDLDWWREAGQEFVAGYVKWRVETDDTWEIASVEGAPAVEVEAKASPGETPVITYTDRLFRDRSSRELIIVDLKTGTRMPDNTTQLGTYSVLLEEKIGEPILWGAFFDARKGALSEPIDLSSWTTVKLGYLYDSLDRAVESNLFIPNLSSFCKTCGVRKSCVWQGGVEPE